MKETMTGVYKINEINDNVNKNRCNEWQRTPMLCNLISEI